MNQYLVVDDQLCIGCGECALDCPSNIIEMEEEQPVVAQGKVERCVQCQHCLAVCPCGALSLLGFDPEKSVSITENTLSAEKLGILMKSRRSIRHYRPEDVSTEDISFLLETAAYAPSGINNRQVQFTVIDTRKVMDELRRKVYAKMEDFYNNSRFPAGMEMLEHYIARALESDTDTIFRGAPHLIIASSPKDSPCPEVDCHIALTYIELLAASMGLGTVWSGLAKWILTAFMPDTLTAMGIPDSHIIGHMMVFGKPKVTYHRTVQRTGNPINRIGSIA
jgi:nitroreductase/NAD-dependent dihydropyrimidine dehydrogenase PreA subunit